MLEFFWLSYNRDLQVGKFFKYERFFYQLFEHRILLHLIIIRVNQIFNVFFEQLLKIQPSLIIQSLPIKAKQSFQDLSNQLILSIIKMIIKRASELRNYHSERQQYLKIKGRMSLELRSHEQKQKLGLKKQSLQFLDSHKIKSKLSEIFKQENELKRIKSSFHEGQTNKKSNNFRQYFSKTFLRRKKRGQSFNHFGRQKMEILNDESDKQISQPAFKIKQLKLKRKGIPFNLPVQFQQVQQIYAVRHDRVLSFAKSKFREERIKRKPQIPEVRKTSESKQMGNNFLKTRRKLRGKDEKGLSEGVISPWQENGLHENFEQYNS